MLTSTPRTPKSLTRKPGKDSTQEEAWYICARPLGQYGESWQSFQSAWTVSCEAISASQSERSVSPNAVKVQRERWGDMNDEGHGDVLEDEQKVETKKTAQNTPQIQV